MTRGEKNNNPTNIRHVIGTTWVGQSDTQTDDAFVQFTDPTYGIRACARILKSYQLEGLLTLSEIIDRWAPPNENNSLAYVTDVCNRCELEPDDPVNYQTSMPGIIKGIVWHENGECIYTDAQIQQGISLA
jgi:hypothetical protein